MARLKGANRAEKRLPSHRAPSAGPCDRPVSAIATAASRAAIVHVLMHTSSRESGLPPLPPTLGSRCIERARPREHAAPVMRPTPAGSCQSPAFRFVRASHGTWRPLSKRRHTAKGLWRWLVLACRWIYSAVVWSSRMISLWATRRSNTAESRERVCSARQNCGTEQRQQRPRRRPPQR